MPYRASSSSSSPQASRSGSAIRAGARSWRAAARSKPPSHPGKNRMLEWLDMAMLTDLLRTSLRLMVPIAFAALGGVICERGGVYNVGMEGMMLSGAFGAALGTFLTGSPVIGAVTGILMGALGGGILGILSIRLNVNQIVTGIAINLVAIGLTAFLARLI